MAKTSKKSVTKSRVVKGSKASSAKKAPAAAKQASESAVIDRRATATASKSDRRDADRRTQEAPVASDRRQMDRREKVSRRRQIDPTTCERDYSSEEIEFMSALDDYKRTSGRMFPTCSEILEVIRGMGYVKQNTVEQIAEPTGPIVVDSPLSFMSTHSEV